MVEEMDILECPYCGSEDLEYMESEFMNELGEPEASWYHCHGCGEDIEI